VIVWQLDLPLSMQSVYNTTKVVGSNSADGDVYSIQHNAIKYVFSFTCENKIQMNAMVIEKA
jgi:hypothetical protein